jgi:hypothetical protein
MQTVHKRTLIFIAAIGVFLLLLAQRTDSQMRENLTNPLPGLTPAQLADFNAGLDEFGDVETVEEGLGPVFNGRVAPNAMPCRARAVQSLTWAWRGRRASAGYSTGALTRWTARYPSTEAANCCNSAPSSSNSVSWMGRLCPPKRPSYRCASASSCLARG